ncbi:TonB-dependent receptor [soil metagenome]
MRFIGLSVQAAVILVSLLVLHTPGAAQQATISGTVRTQGGVPLDSVRVSVVPTGTIAWSDRSGRFRLGVPAGESLVLQFARPGHVDETVAVGATRVGGQREIAVTLAALYALDAVTVTTPRTRPLLNSDGGATGGTVERLELAVLPTDSRRALTLAFTVPGVSQATGFFGDAPPLTIAGSNPLYTQYTLDGLENNEGFLGGPRVELPISALSRFHVHTSSYGAAHGRSSNGVVDMETRSGGESWSGEIFAYHRPGLLLDANPKVAPPGVDPAGFRRLQLGAAAGGALVPRRTFLFAAVEHTGEREDRIGSTARASFLGTEQRETLSLFSRLDHGWNERQTTTVHLAYSGVERAGQGGGVVLPEADITTRRIGALAGLTHRSTLGAGAASNAFSAQIGTYRWNFPPTASDLSTPQVIVVAPDSLTVEAIVGSSNFLFDERELQLQLRNVFEARLAERHTLRIGADVVSSRFQLSAASTSPVGVYTVINEGNIVPAGRFLSITDVPDDVRVLRYSVDARPQQVDLTQTLWGLFVEDRWRVSPSLTVNLGVRWDYDDLTSRGESSPDLNNVQPRASFSWYTGPSALLRGGLGVYAGRFPYAIYSDAVQFGPDGNAVVTLQGSQNPPPRFRQAPSAESFADLTDDFPPREFRATFARGLKQPQSVQSSLGWQREVDGRWAISVDGVWMETFHLPRSWDLNAIERSLTAADTVNRPPEFGDAFRPVGAATGGARRLTTTDSGGRARYLALITNLRRIVTEQLALEANWVFSRSMNDTEDINFNAVQGNDFAAEWAHAINDRRHQLSLRGFYTIGERLTVAAITDFQTGTPINRIAHFRDLDGSGPIFGEGFVGNFDRFPGVGRNAERLPASFVVNGSAAYRHPIGDGALEMKIGGFNLLNSLIVSGFANGIPGGGPRTQLGRPGDPMVFSAAAPPRQFQLSASWLW